MCVYDVFFKFFFNFIFMCSVIVHELEPTDDQCPGEGQLSAEVRDGTWYLLCKLSLRDFS